MRPPSALLGFAQLKYAPGDAQELFCSVHNSKAFQRPWLSTSHADSSGKNSALVVCLILITDLYVALSAEPFSTSIGPLEP